METCQQKTKFPSVYTNQEKSTTLALGLQINKKKGDQQPLALRTVSIHESL